MSKNKARSTIESMRLQLAELQRVSRDEPEKLMQLLPEALAGLQRTLGEADLSASADDGPARSTPSSRDDPGPTKGSQNGTGRHLRAEQDPIMVRMMSAQALCVWANPAWLAYTGRSMQDLSGEGWLLEVHPEDCGRSARACTEAFELGRGYRIEYRLLRANGEYGSVLEIGTPFLSGGSPGAYLATAIDITGYKQAGERLKSQYAIARILSEASALEQVGSEILAILCNVLGWEIGELWLDDDEENGRPKRFSWSSSSAETASLQAFGPRKALASADASAWREHGPLWIDDIEDQEADLALLPGMPHARLRGMFRRPVRVKGEVRGLLWLFSTRVRRRDRATAEFLASVATQLGQYLERQRSAARTRASEARKAAMLEAALDAVITIDHAGRVIEFNPAAETMFGYRHADIVGRELLPLIVPPGARGQALAAFARHGESRESGPAGKRFEAHAVRSDGSEFPVEVAVSPITIRDRSLLTMFVSDISERKQAEDEVRLYQARLRSLMADLLMAEERERRSLAIDLHDGLSQTIALTQMKVSALRRSAGTELSGALDEIGELIAQADSAARSIGFELSPPVLHDCGLGPAMQWLAKSIRARYGIEILLEDDGNPLPADEKTRVILFRSVRELLINAAKHAGVRRVRLSLERENGELSAAVEDEGVGMEAQAVGTNGSGLLSIRERLDHVGGTMHIESAPGRGTRVRLCIPVACESPEEARLEA